MASQIQDLLLPAGTLILVTGANGLIASHIVDQLLHYGYAVRAAVRSTERCSWMTSVFASRHPDSKFEFIQVPDILAQNVYDSALKGGVKAVIHTPAFNSLSDDPRIITDSINANVNLLTAVSHANSTGEKIERVVLTSSSWAVVYPTPNVAMELTSETYNTTSEELLKRDDLPKEARGLITYTVAKVKAEQEAWAYYHANASACGFVLNTVCPSTCIGPVLAPKDQPYPSTAGFVRSLYDGSNAFLFEWLEPQWYVDVRDAARLHVAAAVLKDVEGERVFGFAEPYTWPAVAEVMEKEMGKKCGVSVKDKGEDLSTCWAPRRRAGELLVKLGRNEGWVKFEESVRANVRSYFPA